MHKAHGSVRRAPTEQQLLHLLADGQFHSGEALASSLGISRSAIWKRVRALREKGIEIQAVPKQGYRFPRPVDIHDASAMEMGLPPALRPVLQSLDVLLQVDSTNRYLMEQAGPEAGRASVCVAEVQSAGRGRRGRTWVAPFGSGICFSLAWRFPESPPTLPALSLVVGVAILRALRDCGGGGIRLKWPNDLVWQGRKLAGVLIEVSGESAGPTRVVIGVGINLRMPAQTRMALAEQQAALVADLNEVLHGKVPDRNRIVASLIEHLVAVLQEFAHRGFEAFRDEWTENDALAGAAVKVLAANETILGVARGVTTEGALQVEIGGQMRTFISADVSLRAAKA